jgi:hypothetical protein
MTNIGRVVSVVDIRTAHLPIINSLCYRFRQHVRLLPNTRQKFNISALCMSELRLLTTPLITCKPTAVTQFAVLRSVYMVLLLIQYELNTMRSK